MMLPGLNDLTYLVAIGLLLAISIGLVVWLRVRVLQLERMLIQTHLELEGANNRLTQAKDQAALLSRTDPVTGLPVRHVVIERFQFALALARRQNTTFGIILIQLSDFEQLVAEEVEVGDKLLSAFGTRVLAVAREMDTVGRVQDHEFAVLLPVLQSAGDLNTVMSKLRAVLDPPFTFPGVEQTFRPKVHFGNASYPINGSSWNSLLKAADESLHLSRMVVRS